MASDIAADLNANQCFLGGMRGQAVLNHPSPVLSTLIVAALHRFWY
jgi:hypothetical protein